MTSNRVLARGVLLFALTVLVASAGDVYAATPTISDVAPNTGTTGGGTAVTISGTGFTGATAVTFGGTPALSFEVQSDIRIAAITPPHPEGFVAVSVTTPEGTGSINGVFQYLPVPRTGPDVFATSFNTQLQVFPPGVLSNDNNVGIGDMVASLDTDVTNGTLQLSTDGGFIYQPNPGFVGTDAFSYRATNNFGASVSTRVEINVTLPTGAQAPSGLHASNISGNQVTLRWNAPLIGPAPTGYVIEGGTTPGSVEGTLQTGSTAPIFTFTAPTGAFFFRVRAGAGAEQSAPSNEIRLFINTPAPPSAPENLVGLVNGSELALAWRNSLAGGVPSSLVLDVTGSLATSLPLPLGDTFTFTGVPAGTYTLSLRALNAAGSSAPSTPVTLTFPGPCSGPPLPPSNFLVSTEGGTITAVWDPATSGPASTSYLVNVTGSFVGGIPTSSRSVSGTPGPGSYSLSVIATNVCGASAATAVQTVTIP